MGSHEYEILDANLTSFEPNILNKKFSIIVEAAGKHYQVKPCIAGEKQNISEFIANYVGKCCGAPVLRGAFVQLSEDDLNTISDYSKAIKYYDPIDLSVGKAGLFFGIEWQKDINHIKEYSELMPKVDMTTNRTAFYALYAYDQYLKNYDRHLDNHLITKKGRTYTYNLIDFDRIFGQASWSSMALLSFDYECFKARPWHQHLYDIVDDLNYPYVINYAANISNITDRDIYDLCTTIDQAYAVSKLELGKIRAWLKDRRDEIHSKCISNGHCFSNVTKPGLSSAY